jgi:hypothetical protein
VTNLSAQCESDLSITLEDIDNGFALPVELISPQGVIYNTNANDPTKPLAGRVDHASTIQDPDTGETYIVGNPSVVLRRSSLGRIPTKGESGWMVKIPETPNPTATLVLYATDDRAIIDDPQSGEIMLFLTKLVQS